jgi:cysteine-rich repeat protein
MPVCGNGLREAGEECDDGNASDADACDTSCRRTCGDGVVQPTETCDVAIASGPGSCPTSCAPADPCVRGTLSGAGSCWALCSFTMRTSSATGDGCCLPGDWREEDGDCPTSSCGSGTVESWERCDTAIASGAGTCPMACDDGMVCTRDVLSGAGTCTAACSATDIRDPIAGDGCCPAAHDSRTDSDCVPVLRCEPRMRVASSVSDDASDLVLGRDRSGAIVAAWVERRGGGFSDAIDWSRLDAATGAWAARPAIDSLVSDRAAELALAHDRGGDLVAAWVEERSGLSDAIDWSRLDPATDAWSTEDAVDALVSDDADDLRLEHDRAGDLVAAWIESRGSGLSDAIDWSRLDPATDAWSVETAIDGLVSDAAADLVLDHDRAGDLVAAWVERRGSGLSDAVDWSRLDPASDVWSVEAAISGLVSEEADDLRLAHDAAGDLVAVWIERDPSFGADAVDWSRLDPATDAWTVEPYVTSLVSDEARDLALVHDRAGDLVAAWVARETSSSDAVDWSRLDRTTPRWSTEVTIDTLISDDAAIVRLHRTSSGDLLALWAVLDPSFGGIDWSRLDEGTGRWTASRSLDTFTTVTDIEVIAGPPGQTIVAWIAHDSTFSDSIESAVCGVW